jgi:hypothetical protein
LYWYRKSFEEGANHGVYWDNWFIRPSFNTHMTDAFTHPDGSVSPAAGILGLRELCQRTFQLINEQKMRPITMAHMTSTSILPMLGFATVQYDWEWKYSTGDYQDRFSREWILLTSTGELAGTAPVPLGDHGPQARDPWIRRTQVGVSLVHELNPTVPWKANEKLLGPVLQMIEQGGCEVYRYWDERSQPAVADNEDLPTIVYVQPGRKALIGITSYAGRDMDTRLEIDFKAMGFDSMPDMKNVETGQVQSMPIHIKKHDVHVYELIQEKH